MVNRKTYIKINIFNQGVNNLRFVIWGDSKGKNKGINKKVLNSIMLNISKLEPKPEFMVMLGDTVKGGLNEDLLLNQLYDLNNIISKYISDTVLIPVVGNHEVNIVPKDDRYEKILSQFYSSLNPLSSLSNYNNTVYCKDFEDIRLIVLNSHHPNEIHSISPKQLSWLEEITTDCNKLKLLFVHSPAYPTGAHLGHCLDLYPEKRDNFWNTVERCNINIVFSGHEHNYSRRLISNSSNKDNGIFQIITGGAGEKLRDKYKSKNGVIVSPKAEFHYLIADYNDRCLEITAVSHKGKVLDQFSINI